MFSFLFTFVRLLWKFIFCLVFNFFYFCLHFFSWNFLSSLKHFTNTIILIFSCFLNFLCFIVNIFLYDTSLDNFLLWTFLAIFTSFPWFCIFLFQFVPFSVLIFILFIFLFFLYFLLFLTIVSIKCLYFLSNFYILSLSFSLFTFVFLLFFHSFFFLAI